MSRAAPKLSIVVPAHNEAAVIGATLAALMRAADATQERFAAPYEIIVVDDASDDGTADVAREHGARVVRVNHRRISKVRNAGAAEAAGELLVFVDADTIVPEATLIAAVRALRGGAAGGGARIRMDRPVPLYAGPLLALGNVAYRLVGLCSGCFTFCRRDVFLAAGGYDETLVAAEEAALSRAIKRHGRLVVLREPTITSGRKLRTYSGREVLAIFVKMALRPRRSIRDRDTWGILYDPRRPDR